MAEEFEQDPEPVAGGGARHTWRTPLAIALTMVAGCLEHVGEGLRLGATALMEHDQWADDRRAAREIKEQIDALKE